MCRRKPGPRCHKHAATAFAAAVRRAQRAQADAAAMPEGPGKDAAVERARTEATKAVWAQRELDGSRTEQQRLRKLAFDENAPTSVRDEALLRAEAAAVLRDTRRVQTSLMPEPPSADADPDVRGAYDKLGRVREQIARWDCRIGAGDMTYPPTAEQIAYRERLDAEAFNAERTYRETQMGHADREWLAAEELRVIHTQPGSQLADRLVWLSHARATCATSHHTDQVMRHIQDRDNQIRAEVAAETPPARQDTYAADTAPLTPNPAPDNAGPPEPASTPDGEKDQRGRRMGALTWRRIYQLTVNRALTRRGGLDEQSGRQQSNDVIGDELIVK